MRSFLKWTRVGYKVPDLSREAFGSLAFVKVMQVRMGAFEDDMTQVLIPFVDKNFRTLTDRNHRVMAGLSMGGMETFQVTFDHLDLFSYGFEYPARRRKYQTRLLRVAGIDPEWQTWRRDLEDFAPRLFQTGSITRAARLRFSE